VGGDWHFGPFQQAVYILWPGRDAGPTGVVGVVTGPYRMFFSGGVKIILAAIAAFRIL